MLELRDVIRSPQRGSETSRCESNDRIGSDAAKPAASGASIALQGPGRLALSGRGGATDFSADHTLVEAPESRFLLGVER